jgi:1-acyl-sn-glycerol-3-phosphate acyltransferase
VYFRLRDFARRVAARAVDPEVAARIARIPNRLNEYGYDDWGMKPEAAAYFYSGAAWLYRRYFRVETSGIGHVPPGRVILVANHGGQLPFDGLMLATAMLLEAEPPRLVRGMVERFFPRLPFFSVVIPRLGHVLGTPENCAALLENDEAVMVFPEGVRGSGKLWWDRYRLMEFGYGFMRLALRTRAPIVPVGIVGHEEQAPSFHDAKLVALPTKYRIYFDEPLRFAGDPDAPDAEIARKVEIVKAKMARLIEFGLAGREGVFR